MNPFQRYLLDEFVDDYRAGRMSRRDFVVKSIGVAGGLAAAMGVFSNVGLSQVDVVVAQAAPRVAQTGPDPVTVSPSDPDIRVAEVEFPAADGAAIQGYLAMPARSGGTSAGVVVIHENRALVEHIKDIVRRYAKAGIAAVAPDLVSRDGGVANVSPDRVSGLLARADPQRLVGDAMAAGVYLRGLEGVRADAYGITGFCFGGGVVWETVGQDQAIYAAVPYYGPPPAVESLAHTRAATLGIYAELDRGITGSAPALQEALETAGVPHDYVVYASANHGFFNDASNRYDATASADAWARTVNWFREYLPVG